MVTLNALPKRSTPHLRHSSLTLRVDVANGPMVKGCPQKELLPTCR